MKVLEIISSLRNTPRFKEWHAKNKDSKLVHLFLLLEPEQDPKYDVGFYDFDKQLMTSFTVDDKMQITDIREDKEIFKKENEKITPIDEGKIRICFDDACRKCRELQQKKYKPHTPIKEVVILQNLPIGQVWNITYITKTFNTLNMKVDSETGKILEDKLHEIFSIAE